MKITKRLLAALLAMLMLVSGLAVNASALKATAGDPDEDNAVVITISELESGYAVAKDATIIKKGTETVDSSKYKLFLEGDKLTVEKLTEGTYTITVVSKKDGAEDITADCTVVIKKTPAAPTGLSKLEATKNSIKVSSINGAEYACVAQGAEVTAWQDSNEFGSLKEDTWYDVYARIKATADSNASATAKIQIKTMKAGPTTVKAVEISDVTQNSVTVVPVEGYEYSKDNGVKYQDSNVFTGLTAGSTIFVKQRFKGNEGQEAGVASAAKNVVVNNAAKYTASAGSLKTPEFEKADEIYAEKDLTLFAYSDTRKTGDPQWGDTQLVPVKFELVNNGSTEKSGAFTLNDSDKGQYKATVHPDKEGVSYTVKVYYSKQRFEGASGYKEVDQNTTKTITIKPTKEPKQWQKILSGILNFITTTIPKIAKAIAKVVEWYKKNQPAKT